MLAGALSASLTPRQAAGCTVPVFGYALERWPAEPLPVLVFYRDALSAPAQEFHDLIEQASTAEPNTANVRVQAVNVDAPMDETTDTVWKRHASNTLPVAVCLYPDDDREYWAGPPDAGKARLLLDSPARRSIARHTLKGASGVWVLLRSGQQGKDTQALITLTNALAEAQRTLRLPEVDPADAAEILSPATADLRIDFPIVELDRNDPAEFFFVQMLEKAFRPVPSDEPAAFVFFGRGRVAEELHGTRLAQDQIIPACTFLTGMCSCQIKEMNPGVDLLFSAGWSHYIVGRYALDEALPDLIGLGSLASNPPAVSAPVLPSVTPVPPETPPASQALRTLAGTALLALVLIALISLGLRGRARSRPT
jgi:hypothetical protein